jgi:hypothetical protein
LGRCGDNTPFEKLRLDLVHVEAVRNGERATIVARHELGSQELGFRRSHPMALDSQLVLVHVDRELFRRDPGHVGKEHELIRVLEYVHEK